MGDIFRDVDAAYRWVDARKAFNAARDEYDAASKALHVARVELAEAHKLACELNPDSECMFI